MSKRMAWRALLAAGAAMVLLTGCGGEAAVEEVKINHIHGVGYSGDGKQLYVANHGAFLVHEEDGWLPPPNNHDFMGISLTEKGMYLSGHPAQGSGLKNPLGLSKSTDGGETVEALAAYGELDFHVMAASYRKGTVYVWNGQNHPKVPQGLSYTKDEGKTFTRAEMKGLQSEATALGVHPDRDEVVVFGTPEGFVVSMDNGNTLSAPIPAVKAVSAITVDPSDEDVVWIASAEGKPTLYRVSGFAELLKEAGRVENVKLNAENVLALEKEGDYITSIGVNPKTGAVALVSAENQVLESKDDGKTWEKLAENGTVKIGAKE